MTPRRKDMSISFDDQTNDPKLILSPILEKDRPRITVAKHDNVLYSVLKSVITKNMYDSYSMIFNS
jgi:hypothetical protein